MYFKEPCYLPRYQMSWPHKESGLPPSALPSRGAGINLLKMTELRTSWILNRWAKTHPQSPNGNFFQSSNKGGFKCSSQKCPDQTNQKLIQNASASALTYSTSFDHIAAVPKSLHWKPVKCYIHFKELLLFSKVLNAKLESRSNLLFALCS